MFKYVKDSLPANAAISFFKPRVMTLYTHRKSAYVKGYMNIINSGIDYVVCGPTYAKYAITLDSM